MSAKEQVVVLHLSDLHFGWEGDENRRTDRSLALNGLFRVLDKLKPVWKPDCVCISGDIGWGGNPNDYKDAKSWIEQLLSQLKLSPNALFMCPGNHDANRNVAQRNARPSSPTEADRVLGIPIQEHHLKPFEAYIEFCKQMGTPPYRLGPNESYLVGCRSFQGINFVAYNSAWSSQDDYDKEKLWLGLPQIRYMEKENQVPNPEQIAEWPPIIAFFHHPYEFFHPDELHAWAQRPNSFDYMARRCHLFFTGHTHAEVREADKVGGGGWHLSGGATFAGAAHFNFFRVVQVKADRLVYRTFEFDPRSADNAWLEKGNAKRQRLPLRASSRKGMGKTSSPLRAKKVTAVVSSDENSALAAIEPKLTAGTPVPGDQSASTQTAGFDWDVFISYSRTDEEMAMRVRTALGKKGVRVWIDTEQILPGDLFVSKMEDGLEQSASVAILVSPASMESGWVEEEYSRAISLTKRVNNPVRVIPVLIERASLPGFLSNRSWVDFQDQSRFNVNIELLVKGIVRPANHQTALQVVSAAVKPLLTKISFLWFFPEGMLAGLYRFLIAEMGLEDSDTLAKKEGLVRILDSEGPDMIGADAERVRELRGLISDPAKTASELLATVKRWVDARGVFQNMAGLGPGRSLLIRDLLTLAQHLPAVGDSNDDLKAWACQMARVYLPDIAEQHLRIGVEVSKGLMAANCARAAKDDLVLARLLLLMGEARQAADLFEAYRGPDLFDQMGLDEMERFNFALDWAKATKDMGRARQMHSELISAYGRMLQLLRQLKPVSKEERQAIGRAEVDVLNNRATQIAQFGEDTEWSKAQKSFPQIYEIYERLKDNDRLLGARANFVAQSLDRLERQKAKATEKELRPLLTSLEKLDSVAAKSKASENVFFFLYQKARLLKRLYPDEPAQAAEYYKLAAEVAERAGLHQRAAIARCWELRLQERAGEMSENAYLAGLQQCADSLRAHTDDAWAARALGNVLLDIARVLRNRGATADAWTMMIEAFDLEVPRFVWSESSTTDFRLKRILQVMNGLKPDEDKRATFLEKNAPLLRRLSGAPEHKNLAWNAIADWLK
jgi:hypothetical protein